MHNRIHLESMEEEEKERKREREREDDDDDEEDGKIEAAKLLKLIIQRTPWTHDLLNYYCARPHKLKSGKKCARDTNTPNIHRIY